jgi:predicted nuclease of restriction endonuclease-like (RecB) superfamily
MTDEMNVAARGEKLLADVRRIIEEARRAVYAGMAAVQLEHNWKIGRRIVEEEQGGNVRAEYAKRTIAELSAHLCAEFGEGYSPRALAEYKRFYLVFPDLEILHTRVQNLTWSHFRLLLRVGEPKVREWYMQEASGEGWSVRTLDRNIATQYCQRLLASQADRLPVVAEMKEKTAAFQRDKLEFIKNPSVLEFIGLKGNQGLVEGDLEKGILAHLREFMLELGKGFAFVESQRLVRTECRDYFVDLVFYNFMLKCFFLVDLKMGRITHQDVGQMDMYVRMFDERVRQADDNPTIGIVLCGDTDPDIARYSILHGNERLFASKYQLQLPTPEELTDEVARQRATLLLQMGDAHAEGRRENFSIGEPKIGRGAQ